MPRIELGTGVVPTFPRHPMMLAQQCLTTNQAASGRLCLGIGLSHKMVIESMFGLSFDKPVRHLREYLSVLGPLSRGEPVSFDGDDYKVHAGVAVKGSSPFPIVVAALGAQTLKVTAELADGTYTWCTGPKTLAEHTIPTINAAAEAAGRPAPRVISALPVCVTVRRGVGRASGRRRSSPSTGNCPATGRCSTARVRRGPPTSPSSAPPTRSPSRCWHSGEIGVTDFAASEFGANPDEVEATRAALVGCLSSR